jgi:DNA-binding NarL/FixJ family response regulator
MSGQADDSHSFAVAALTSDLMTGSQIAGAASRAGSNVTLAQNVDSLLSAVERDKPALVLIDLTHPGLDLANVVARLKQSAPQARVVAFGPHVHAAKLSAARDEGCDFVMPRGQLLANLDAILSGRFGGER